MMTEVFNQILAQTAAAAAKSGRGGGQITVVAATKMVPLAVIKEAVGLGIAAIGENRVQEAQQKLTSKEEVPAAWHFIGHLQRNKVKPAVQLFDVIQSLDSVGLAARINQAAKEQGKTQHCFIQLKVTPEPSKHGIQPEALKDFSKALEPFDHIQIDGLMTMAPYTDDPETSRTYFKKAHDCFLKAQQWEQKNITLQELSMGMSRDYGVAIEEGATMVRLGEALFGGQR